MSIWRQLNKRKMEQKINYKLLLNALNIKPEAIESGDNIPLQIGITIELDVTALRNVEDPTPILLHQLEASEHIIKGAFLNMKGKIHEVVGKRYAKDFGSRILKPGVK